MANTFSGRTFIGLNPRIELKNSQGELVSFDLTGSQHILGREPQKPPPEGLRVPEDWLVISRCQACFRRVDNNYYIYDGDGENPSTNRLFINNTLITPKEGYRLQHGNAIKIGQNPQNLVILTYIDPKVNQTAATPKQRSISLKDRSIMLGRGESANLQLESPNVSRCHATIDTDDRGRYVLKDHSTNGVFVNKQKVTGSAIITPGTVIQIGPYTFVLQGDELVLIDQGDNIRLDAKNLVRVVENKDKQKIRLLNDISLAIEPGQFVALVGGSGAGKSTLMKTLLGIEPSTQGTVYLNGDNLREHFNIYRNLIGYVPQQDIVHGNLKVREVLYYAAKLRLPTDINVEPIVEKTLEQIELTKRQNTLVNKLSGGQLKRVSIGVELLADPKLFFLDEPTSGLDPGLDKKMMQLLRKLADEGRTVVLVTHATTNITLCDRLTFLGLGGNLCYFGPSNEATKFFQITNGDFADIYIKLEAEEAVISESDRFHKSNYYKEYIDAHLGEISQEHQSPQRVKRSFWQQLSILTQRYIKLILRDPVYLGLSLLTAPIGIILVYLAIQNNNFLIPVFGDKPDFKPAALARQVLFVFTCAAIWVGFASSLQEIVKECTIYLRERLVNLGLFAYLGSKVVTLGGLALIQSILISLAVFLCFKSPETLLTVNYDTPDNSIPSNWLLGFFITTFLTILASISLGLMVSAKAQNSSQANSALPLLLLPQIIFAGILFDMQKIPIGSIISSLMLSRWSVGAYGILANINQLYPTLNVEIEKPFEPLNMFDATIGNLALSWGALIIHTTVYLVITFWLQKSKDIFK